MVHSAPYARLFLPHCALFCTLLRNPHNPHKPHNLHAFAPVRAPALRPTALASCGRHRRRQVVEAQEADLRALRERAVAERSEHLDVMQKLEVHSPSLVWFPVRIPYEFLYGCISCATAVGCHPWGLPGLQHSADCSIVQTAALHAGTARHRRGLGDRRPLGRVTGFNPWVQPGINPPDSTPPARVQNRAFAGAAV